MRSALVLLRRAQRAMARRRGHPVRIGGSSSGAALLEALVAAALVAVALMLVVALLTHSARLRWRAEAQREAFASLEAVIEGVRAGGLELDDAEWTRPLPPWVRLRRGAVLRLDVREPTDEPSGVQVCEIEVSIRYPVNRGDVQTRTLVTRLYRPNACPPP